MIRKMILGSFLLAAISLYGQKSTDNIELLGKGIVGMEEASISISDWEKVDYIVAEAIYACETAPGNVKISSGSEDRIIAPQLISGGGNSNTGLITSVFRTKFTSPTPQVALDILDNATQFRSFSLYVHRLDGSIKCVPAVGMPHIQGELVHIINSKKIPELTVFNIPLSSKAKEIQVKFGLTEFRDDDLVAVFTFESEGETVATEIRTWFRNGQVDACAIQEVLFESVPGEVDKIHLSMFSANDSEESFIAGRVFIDWTNERNELLSDTL